MPQPNEPKIQSLSLQAQILVFVNRYGPTSEMARTQFVDHLRYLMNQYARAAIIHGNISEKGAPHRHGEQKPDAK